LAPYPISSHRSMNTLIIRHFGGFIHATLPSMLSHMHTYLLTASYVFFWRHLL
jgi:hypothetical protein